jgi:hypothetical protein
MKSGGSKGIAMKAAVGFRAHSGWAAVVVLAGPPRSPIVIHRSRIELVPQDTHSAKQPYHAAEAMSLPQAEKFIRRSIEDTERMAQRALRALVDELRAKGYQVKGCGLLLGSGRPLGSLAATLASHALIHAAEGNLFREALQHASQHCRLPVTGTRERELHSAAVKALRMPLGKLQASLVAMGRTVGPPWALDQKHAALAAWIALGAKAARRHS